LRKGAQAATGRRCASCHADIFAGTKAVARIAGQREEYLLKALHDYNQACDPAAAWRRRRMPLSPQRRENRSAGASLIPGRRVHLEIFIVPAKAGTHTPCSIASDDWAEPLLR